MANEIDTSRPAREHLLFQAYKHFDENPPTPEIARLREDARIFVPGDGSMYPRAIFIGEAPGAVEDRDGIPFVGQSGRLLDSLLAVADLRRTDVWVTNVVKYRPIANRTPYPDEVKPFASLLRRELAYVAGERCRIAVGLGRIACSVLAGEDVSVSREHGTVRELRGNWKLFVSYHPAAALRSSQVNLAMKDDFVELRKVLRMRAREIAG